MKHTILGKYLSVWIPILSSSKTDLIYIDGFAGPGEYKDGEPGSPIIALDAVKNQVVYLKGKVHFIFIEKDKKRCEHLIGVISKYNPSNTAIIEEPKSGDFAEEVSKMLDKIDREIEDLQRKTGRRYNRVPTFAFIDPFGYKMPMSIIKRLMSTPKSEILVTFVIPELKRFCMTPSWNESMNNLFASNKWGEVINFTKSQEKTEFLRDLYIKQLKEYAEIKHILYFKMINKNNQTAYYLIFGTNYWRGIEEMKRAMWSVDPSGDYTFSDLSHPGQTTLMDFSGFDYSVIQKELKKLSSQELTIWEIRQYITLKTPYSTRKLRTEVLTPLELRGELIALSPRRTKRISYPSDKFKVKIC